MPTIRREITSDNICVLTFDRPESSANIFDRATLEELDEQVATMPSVAGVVFLSAKKSIFVAGADLRSVTKLGKDELRDFIALGQSVFSRIAALRVPTVAAIHGAALGGGYEICLACKYRVASPDRATKIGLPEINLGLLPAWGGCTRLPRAIGLARALDVILAGKTLPAKAALKYGMIDEIAPCEYLLQAATRAICQGRKHRTPFVSAKPVSALIRSAAASRARAAVMKKTRGHYPAPLEALRVIIEGVRLDEKASLQNELESILKLTETDATRNLLRLFFLQERAKKLSVAEAGAAAAGAAPAQARVSRAAVIGAGVMGAGIAQWLSARGIRVLLRDIDAERVAAGIARISKLYAEGVKRHVFTQIEARDGMDRILPVATEVPLKNVELVIEAAVEKLDLKKKIFTRLDELADAQTVLATNTSALSIGEIAGATRDSGRVVGVHFFNPVHKMQLVEVVAGRDTRPDVLQRAIRFVQQIGKLPVLVRDSPGFLVNRILMPYLIEAGHLFENGAAVAEIDGAMLDFGMPMGPLRLIDEVGVDVCADVAVEIVTAFRGHMSVPPSLTRMIDAKLLGKKSGRGFYVHSAVERVNDDVNKFRRSSSAVGLDRTELQKRMVLLMVNEAARCIEEKVVASAEDVDFGMVMGTGWAPFRGGPLRYADAVGAGMIVAELRARIDTAGAYFAPCELLKTMAADGRRFYAE
jgi:3-hydroxyacyl-CoA dehydrogenase / enoyl-CoA hydratase / 3-hydroxybutyryl-CoA epimerase